MANYGRTSGTGGRGTGAITNDDEFTLDLPEEVNFEKEGVELKDYMSKGAY